MNILDYIPYGYENAVTLSMLQTMTGCTCREIRRLIEQAFINGDPIINLQDGKGYFQPTEDDFELVQKYIRQEESRISKLIDKYIVVKKYLKGE